MIFHTPNWPYDLTDEQQRQEEAALVEEINGACRKMIPGIAKRLEGLIETAQQD
jgi:hypothetical protein